MLIYWLETLYLKTDMIILPLGYSSRNWGFWREANGLGIFRINIWENFSIKYYHELMIVSLNESLRCFLHFIILKHIEWIKQVLPQESEALTIMYRLYDLKKIYLLTAFSRDTLTRHIIENDHFFDYLDFQAIQANSICLGYYFLVIKPCPILWSGARA